MKDPSFDDVRDSALQPTGLVRVGEIDAIVVAGDLRGDRVIDLSRSGLAHVDQRLAARTVLDDDAIGRFGERRGGAFGRRARRGRQSRSDQLSEHGAFVGGGVVRAGGGQGGADHLGVRRSDVEDQPDPSGTSRHGIFRAWRQIPVR